MVTSTMREHRNILDEADVRSNDHPGKRGWSMSLLPCGRGFGCGRYFSPDPQLMSPLTGDPPRMAHSGAARLPQENAVSPLRGAKQAAGQ